MFPAPRRVRRKRTRLRGASRDPPGTQTHRWPPDGQSVSPGQRRDLAGPAAVAILPGPIR